MSVNSPEMGCVVSTVIWSVFRMRQERDDDNSGEDAPHFTGENSLT